MYAIRSYYDLRLAEQRSSTHRKLARFGMQMLTGIDQAQVADPEVGHGSSRHADIPGALLV